MFWGKDTLQRCGTFLCVPRRQEARTPCLSVPLVMRSWVTQRRCALDNLTTWFHLSKLCADLMDQLSQIIKCLRARTESSPTENNALQFIRLFDIDYPISSSDTTDGEIFIPTYRDTKFHSAQEP